MGKYTVTTGQNLFDVALHIYGSAEGVVDLMMNNTSLSLCDTLQAGDQLTFTDDYVIDPDVAAYYRNNRIIPANGERHVYYKHSELPPIGKIYTGNQEKSVGFSISGSGVMDVDWGDNSPIQTVALQQEPEYLYHSFDHSQPELPRIRFFGDVYLTYLDLTDFKPVSILLFRPLPVEKFVLRNCHIDLVFTALLRETFEINLQGIRTANLSPLATQSKLMNLDLTGMKVETDQLDRYLVALVRQYYQRRNCTIILPGFPSGEYAEPARDGNNHYVLHTGMEAIWVITHEPAWNEGGYWKFIVQDQVYTSEP